MTKTSGRSTALIPTGQRKPPAKRKAVPPATVPASVDTLLPILGSELAVAKLLGTGGEMTREGGVVLVTGRAYATSAGIIPAQEIYYDRASRPEVKGPWLGEADKVSWRDEASGYDCIMMRDRTFEREVGFRRHLFARRGRDALPGYTHRNQDARMPTRSVAWSQTFADAASRDDMFAWLAARVHRWDDWGELAYRKGADALTRHLLSVIIGSGGLSK